MLDRLMRLLGLRAVLRWFQPSKPREQSQKPPAESSFGIRFDGPERILLSGRWDASQGEVAQEFLDGVERSAVVDFSKLQYIASDGLGLIFAAHKRLLDNGEALKLVNLSPHIREVFKLAAFDRIFEIE